MIIRKTAIAITLILTATISILPFAQADSSVVSNTSTVKVHNKSFTVHTVTINMMDPYLELRPVIAAGGVGHDESFASIIKRENAVAAVNGTFFNAYEDNPYVRYPNGALLDSGQLLHSGENQTLILTADRKADMIFTKLAAEVRVTGESSSYTVKPWGVNKYFGEEITDQVVLYNDQFGGWVGFKNGTKVVIENNKISRLTNDAAAVPDGGYVLFVGNSSNNLTHLLPHLHQGDAAEIAVVSSAASGEGEASSSPSQWLAALGAGPKLVTEGALDINFARDGYKDPKITQGSAARSFAGVHSSGKLMFGTVPSATIHELAEIALKLGLKEAMNLDGGASSGLYANGRMITTPGRELSNVLVVRKLDQPKVQVSINGQVLLSFHGYLHNGTAMVPVRPLIQAMQVHFSWDAASRTATIQQESLTDQQQVITVQLKEGQSRITIQGEKVPIPVPLSIQQDGLMYVPLRAVTEAFNAEVKWDAALYRASITLPESELE